jgi:hypothetical protein
LISAAKIGANFLFHERTNTAQSGVAVADFVGTTVTLAIVVAVFETITLSSGYRNSPPQLDTTSAKTQNNHRILLMLISLKARFVVTQIVRGG